MHPRGLVPLIALLLPLLAGCAGEPETPRNAAPRSFTILAVNDVYRIEGVDGGSRGGLARLRGLRAELERQVPDLLLLHAGDLLFPSLLSRSYDGAQMIDVLNLLDGAPQGFDERLFLTFGNHEFDQGKLEDAPLLRSRVEESRFTWLASDIEWAAGDDGRPLVAAEHLIRSTIVESGGVRVGLFSLSTDEKHPLYVESFGDPQEVARRTTAELRRQGAEVVVGLTHLKMSQDVALLEALGGDGPDLVIGGHEHNQLSQNVGGRWVIKADAEARTATVATLTLRADGPPQVDWGYRELGPETPADPAVQAAVDGWLERHNREYCGDLGKAPGCLDDVLGRTRVRLLGEELEIRRYESNLGNWVADQALAAMAAHGAQAAFINSGSLRLGRDILPGEVTRRDIEGIFQYRSELRLLKLSGAVLQQVLDHAVTDWTGNGRWLQVSGLAFRHDPTTGTADRPTLLAAGGPRPIAPDDEILVVTSDFLAEPDTGQDGYTMLTRQMWVEVPGEAPELRDLAVGALAAAGEAGIAPAVEGRICNTERAGSCLAVDGG